MPSHNPNYSVEAIKEILHSGDVWVREFTVEANQEVPWHRHTQVQDHCYGLEGMVRVQSLSVDGKTADFILRPGEYCIHPAGTSHRLSCGTGVRARYLLVQQGQYDFVKVKPGS